MTVGRAIVLGALVVLSELVVTGVARAQPGCRVDLVVTALVARDLDVEGVRAGLARELGCDVRLAPIARRRAGVATLSIRASQRRGAVELLRVREDGTRLLRGIGALPDDAQERVATVVIIAANMLRDEASELLEMMRAGEGESAAESEPATESEPAAEPEPEVEADSDADPESEPEPEADSDADPESEPEADADADSDADADADADADVDADAGADPAAVHIRSSSAVTAAASSSAPTADGSPPSEPFLRLGLGVQLGSVPRGAGYEATLVGGLEIAYTAAPFLAIGLRDVGGGVLGDQGRSHYGGAPFVELAWALIPELALYGQLGAQLQALADGGRDVAAGVAPLLALGARFQLAREISIALETSARVVATEVFLTHLHALPQGAVLWTGGLSLLFHIS